MLKHYEEVSTDWDAKLYCGISLTWDYVKRKVHLSMPGYVEADLTEFLHDSTKTEHGPHPYTKTDYGAGVQLMEVTEALHLDKAGIFHILRVVGKSLYYAYAVDSTMLAALSTIAS